MTSLDADVVVVGAGPYGLAVGAHLRSRAINTRVIGHAMSFWEDHMPTGMLLRSPWGASTISDPTGRLSLDAYQAQLPTPLERPLPRADFVRYGRWFAARVLPDIDQRAVARVEWSDGAFLLELEGGDSLRAGRVVLATGLRRAAHIPPALASLDADTVTHAMNVKDTDRFAGRSVVVVGAGQSAVETAVLAQEAGATVELIARAPTVRWLTRSARLHRIRPVLKFLYAPTDVGPAGLSWIVSLPVLFRLLPGEAQRRAAYRSIRPAAAGWLVDRAAPLTMTFGRRVVRATASADGACLTLDDGSERRVDNVILATGYRIDVAADPLLGPSLLKRLRVVDGYPVLTKGLRSSVDGLHFVGAAAAPSFGPVMRFVAGTAYAAPATAQDLAART